MNIAIHEVNGINIAEIVSDGIAISNAEEGLDLLGNLYFSGYDKAIIHSKNITPDFFDLKTGIAGEILQKFTNYRVRLVIIGNFTQYESNSLRDFIFESNKGKQINFAGDLAEGLQLLSS